MSSTAHPVTDTECPLCGASSSNTSELTSVVREELRKMLQEETGRRYLLPIIKQALGDAAARKLGLSAVPPETKLTVVVPVYNEYHTIRAILKRIEAVPIRKEIIVVDDFSTDGTREILQEFEQEEQTHALSENCKSEIGGAQAEDSETVARRQGARDHLTDAAPILEEAHSTIRVFFHGRNRGKGAALRTGFSQVTDTIVVVQDADLEYNPAVYPELIEPIIDGRADVVYGSRFIGETHRALYFWHYIGNKLLTTLSNMFTGLNLTDMETCYKVFRREVIDDITPTLKSNRFGFEPEVTAKIARRGLRVYELPISYSGREYSEGKKITWKDAFSALWCVIRYRFGD